MSEMEELKKNADLAKQKQIVENLSLHLRECAEKLDVAWMKERNSWNLYLAAWFFWVGVGFFEMAFPTEVWAKLIHGFGFFVFLAGWFYTFLRGRELSRASGTYYGTYKTLWILGYTDWDPDAPVNRVRLKQGVWQKGIDIVKGWNEKRKAAGLAPA